MFEAQVGSLESPKPVRKSVIGRRTAGALAFGLTLAMTAGSAMANHGAAVSTSANHKSPSAEQATTPASTQAAIPAHARTATPTKTVSSAEEATMRQVPISEVVKNARPAEIPTSRGNDAEGRQGPDGPQLKVDGTRAPAASADAAASVTQNGYWPGAYNQSPNRQIGKLYFDRKIGVGFDWGHCTATVVTAGNLSTIVTAGHCVFNPDPDQNGYIGTNGYWYENFQFCPGYENGCKLGVWNFRRAATTSSWFYGYGAAHKYDYRDDFAVVLLSPDASGRYVQNVVGSQGITFNAATSLIRYSFGYPVTDSRWPAYTYSGNDLAYCYARDTADSTIVGTMWIPCTMTGGASGGPWLTSPNASWGGYVNSVNSHKPWGGAYMNGPYFNAPESDLFVYWRTR